jgi:4-hydroxy-tetrahydrodipicolinate synthase
MGLKMRRLSEEAAGVFIIAVTPFTENGDLDLESLDHMTDFYVGCGVDGITILGMMGEAQKLTYDESRKIAAGVIRRARDIPVVVGVSSPGFAAMRELTQAVMDLGAAGVMVAPPATVRTDEGILDYFAQTSQAIGKDVPFVLQDYPQANGVHISPEVIIRVFNQEPNCVVLKHEDWPGLGKLTALRVAEKSGRLRRVSILVGNGGLFLAEEMGRGADGAMTGFAYPEMMVEVCRAFREGDAERGRDIFDSYLPLVRYEQQPGIGLAVRKYVLMKRGAIRTASTRLPSSRLDASDIAEIDWLIARQERRLAAIN